MTKWNEALADIAAGARRIAPLIVAVIPIGMVYGAVAATKGLSPLETVLMSALVFAGGSQFVALDIWTHPASWVSLGFAALLVNVRHVLMSASLGTKLQAFSGPQKVFSMLFLADEIWAMSEFRARETVLKPLWYLGLVLPFYCAWVLSGLAGSLLGAFIGDPALIGLDFAFPAVFIVLVMGFWKGSETGLVLLASATCALTVHHFVPGVWYIAAGALGGLVVAALIGGESEEVPA
ncbi:MAG: branched-chain amino acid ABC transporter permease [Rhizobium sp. 63-7]|nr:MAG: branched-chain amino acid ABC transporter permease [Rhizobium sp. 63-7]